MKNSHVVALRRTALCVLVGGQDQGLTLLPVTIRCNDRHIRLRTESSDRMCRHCPFNFKPDNSALEFLEEQDDGASRNDRVKRMAAFLAIRLGVSVARELQKQQNRTRLPLADSEKQSNKSPTVLSPAESKRGNTTNPSVEQKPPIVLGPASSSFTEDVMDEPPTSTSSEKSPIILGPAMDTFQQKDSNDTSAIQGVKNLPHDALQDLNRTLQELAASDDGAASHKKKWDWKQILQRAAPARNTTRSTNDLDEPTTVKIYNDFEKQESKQGPLIKDPLSAKLQQQADPMDFEFATVLGEQETQGLSSEKSEADIERPSSMHKKEGDRNVALKDEFLPLDTEPAAEADSRDATAEKVMVASTSAGFRPPISTAFGRPLQAVEEGLPPLRNESNPLKSSDKI